MTPCTTKIEAPTADATGAIHRTYGLDLIWEVRKMQSGVWVQVGGGPILELKEQVQELGEL